MPKPTANVERFDPQDFKQKFSDGTPVPADYAAAIAAETFGAFNAEVNACEVTEDDELTMGAYWVPGWRPDRAQD